MSKNNILIIIILLVFVPGGILAAIYLVSKKDKSKKEEKEVETSHGVEVWVPFRIVPDADYTGASDQLSAAEANQVRLNLAAHGIDTAEFYRLNPSATFQHFKTGDTVYFPKGSI
ncbi:MAG TPA: hypothetical protein VK152_11605 [Paludibacter sp.]|nr:hypothetical protein [Paludibacter sp.]